MLALKIIKCHLSKIQRRIQCCVYSLAFLRTLLRNMLIIDQSRLTVQSQHHAP